MSFVRTFFDTVTGISFMSGYSFLNILALALALCETLATNGCDGFEAGDTISATAAVFLGFCWLFCFSCCLALDFATGRRWRDLGLALAAVAAFSFLGLAGGCDGPNGLAMTPCRCKLERPSIAGALEGTEEPKSSILLGYNLLSGDG